MTHDGGSGVVVCIPAVTPPLADAIAAMGLGATGAPDGSAGLARLGDERVSCAAVVVNGAAGGFDDAVLACKLLRSDPAGPPILFVVPPDRLDDVAPRAGLFDDFAMASASVPELAARLAHLVASRSPTSSPSTLRRGPLAINLATYQVTISGHALDLTYMEYELLRYLASHPEEVVSRETLLSRVWGYEYYGGARTVDVHVRRLRAKLGEEHAHLIQTVRGVGYRFA